MGATIASCASADPPVGACAPGIAPATRSASAPSDDPSVADLVRDSAPLESIDDITRWVAEPGESTFSSPQVADLNGDGTGDVLLGLGQDTLGARTSSMLAIDGASGATLWRSAGHEDLIGSPTFAHLGGDATIDVVIGGRRGALIAFDGTDGTILWEFDDQGGRWFNFYTPQLAGDLTGDGIEDLVAVNGGLGFDEPAEGPGTHATEQRYLGRVFVIDGSDGSTIASSAVPDRGESYMSAPVLDGTVIVGTGGETLPGSLWQIDIDALLTNRSLTPDTAGVSRLLSGGQKGMIAAPSIADLSGDCKPDIVVVAFDGTISAIDASTGSMTWSVPNPGFESYSSPTLGYFVGDDRVPDVFASVANGTWPDYESSDYLLIDGKTGAVVWRQTMGTFAPSGFVAADINGDGQDEVVFGVNDVSVNRTEIYVLDTSDQVLHRLTTLGQTTFSSPWIGDLDDDGRLDLITVASAYQADGPAVIRRIMITGPGVSTASWPGYLGQHRDGQMPPASGSRWAN